MDSLYRHGFVQIAAVSPEVEVGNPRKNVDLICNAVSRASPGPTADVIVLPELAITGYSVRDLILHDTLLDEADRALGTLADRLTEIGFGRALVFVGTPFRHEGELFNCAAVLHRATVIAMVPKTHIPTYGEFEERRWFRGATELERGLSVSFGLHKKIPFGTDLLFETSDGLCVFAEVCEDLFMPVPPSSVACMHGANVLVNLSASTETVGKADYRRRLVTQQAERCLAAYAYASAGPSESTTDVVFSGHCLVSDNGTMVSESSHIGDGTLSLGARWAVGDVDVQRLEHERRRQQTFGDCKRIFPRQYRRVIWDRETATRNVAPIRRIAANPFVPSDPATLDVRCRAVFDIQVAGLAKRLNTVGIREVAIGVSGGLDSAHALLVTHKTFQTLGYDPRGIKALTMPGFGTTSKTRGLAHVVMDLLGVDKTEIDIRAACVQVFRDLGHSPFGIDLEELVREAEGHARSEETLMTALLKGLTDRLLSLPPDRRADLTFENVQARLRTLLLMSRGFQIGTGDLSELLAGWCTYNGDQMSMYGVNAGVPKTLVKFLVQHVAKHHYPEGQLRDALLEISGLSFSPELLPVATRRGGGQITEDSIGPYELRDFYTYHVLRGGATPEKALWLAANCELALRYTPEERHRTMESFIRRLFSQQFKRSAMPDGPKVGTISLSPRGDWRMPSDANAAAWLAAME